MSNLIVIVEATSLISKLRQDLEHRREAALCNYDPATDGETLNIPLSVEEAEGLIFKLYKFQMLLAAVFEVAA